MRVQVVLNGTKSNPYERYGLRRNPFPAIPYADPRFRATNQLLADLDANPIRDATDLRNRLVGCDPKFIEGCVARFRKGKRVKFTISFPDPSDREAS